VKDRADRLKAVRQIIKEYRINSQETLLDHLRDQGFTVTQATLSRDLKVLKVGKVSEGSNGYYYTLPTEEELRESQHNHAQDLKRGYLSMDFSGNLAIVRTLTGHADTVGIALDNIGIREIVGTVAGDDTVLVVFRENTNPERIRTQLRELVPELGE